MSEQPSLSQPTGRKRHVEFADDVNFKESTKKLRKTGRGATADTLTTNAQGDGESAAKKRENRLHDGKYTLDSDEDDEKANVNEMNQDELDDIGQEEQTIGFDDEIKITPFNVEEEMEEGHYDETGCFQWKRDKDEVHDAWLDEVDWNDVKNYKLKNPQATGEGLDNGKKEHFQAPRTRATAAQEDDDDDSVEPFHELDVIRQMLTIMQPGENVVRTIKRLGTTATSVKAKQRSRQQQSKKPLPGEQVPPLPPLEVTPEEMKKSKIHLEEMTGLAHQFVSHGQLDIYQETYERLKAKLNRSASTTATTVASSFDMYGDEEPSMTTPASSVDPKSTSTVLWEFKLDDAEEKVDGPYTSEQMVKMSSKFEDKDKVRCRRVGTEQFYALKRIDFDLYID